MIKLALVDDDPWLLDSLKSHLGNFSEVEVIASNTSGLAFATELATTAPEQLPDVIIMDVSMGTHDEGIRATAEIKKQYPSIHVIMFTISDNDDLIFEAFKAGAMGYLLKNETPSTILKAIQDVMAGDAQMSPGIAKKTIDYLRTGTITKKVEDETHKLSARELEILDVVAKGYTYNQVGGVLHISPMTVRKHMTNIFNKLHVKNKIEALIKTESYRDKR